MTDCAFLSRRLPQLRPVGETTKVEGIGASVALFAEVATIAIGSTYYTRVDLFRRDGLPIGQHHYEGDRDRADAADLSFIAFLDDVEHASNIVC